jgi:hypothetical protein
VDRITYDELGRDLRLHYETTRICGLNEADTRFQALQPFFNGRRAASLKGALAEKYVQYRLKAGVANATINRELATLIRMLRLGYERDKLAKLPRIHKLTEAPTVTIAPSYGWRMQSEVLALTLRWISALARYGSIRWQ